MIGKTFPSASGRYKIPAPPEIMNGVLLHVVGKVDTILLKELRELVTFTLEPLRIADGDECLGISDIRTWRRQVLF